MIPCRPKLLNEHPRLKTDTVSALDPHPHPRWRPALVVAAILLLGAINFGYGLDRLPLIGPDEPRYAEVAREMYDSGDWITPRLAGRHWFEKPALLYWLAAGGYSLFGVNEGAARAGVAVLALLGVLLIFFFGRRVGGAKLGASSAAALSTMGLWIAFSRGATFDLPLAVCCTAACAAFWLWWEQERPGGGARWWYLCSAALGLAVLAKGLIGLVLPGAIIGLYLLLTGGLADFLRQWRRTAVGAMIFLATAAIWYGPMFARHGSEFFSEFFLAHHVERFLTDKFKHPQPFYFFFLVAPAGVFPWIGYLVGAVGRDARRWRDLRREKSLRWRLYVWLWALLPIVFFSFSGSKLPGYILPVFPALALLVGAEMAEQQRHSRASAVAACLLLMLVAAGLGWRGADELGAAAVGLRWVAGIGIAVGLTALAAGRRFGWSWSVPVICGGVALLVIATVHGLFPTLGTRESIRDLALEARSAAAAGERLIFYIDNHHGINFYATELPLRNERADLLTAQHGDEILARLGEAPNGSLLLLSFDRWMPSLEGNGNFTIERLGRQQGLGRCSPGCDWVLSRVRKGSGVAFWDPAQGGSGL